MNSTTSTYSNLKSVSKSVIKDYSLISKGIFSVALLFAIVIVVSPLASAQTPTESTVNYEIDDTVFANPERGFYKWSETHSDVYDYLDTIEMQMYRTNYVDESTGSNPITIISRNFYLENFLNSDVSSEYLANMQADFDAAREAGSKIRVKFAYHKTCNWPGYEGLDAEPARVLQHIVNLKNVLNANADVILVVQLGFIGAWGEWWATDTFAIPPTKSGNCVGPSGMTEQNWADRRAVVFKIVEELDPDRMVQLRNIKWKTGIFERDTPITDVEGHSGTVIARTGHFNDCFLANPTNSGTYSSNSTIREQQKAYLEAETTYLPMGGETCGSYSPESYCSNAIAEMERMHWSYLNTDYDHDILSQWDLCIEEIKKRLGYRFELNSGTYTDSVQPGSQFNINIDLKNVGFAAPFNPRDVELILRDQSTYDDYKVKLPDDPRFWLASQSTTYSITRDICTPSLMPTGTYDMFLNLPDPYSSIADRPEYSIRLASTDSSNGATIWETWTGYNNLLKTISVTNSVNSPSCSSSLILSADGSSPPPSVPDAPTGLVATAVSSSQVNLSWSAPSNDGGSPITGYQIEVKEVTGSWSILVANAGVGTFYSHTGTTSDTTYTYRISAINSVGTSVLSNEASTTTQPPPTTTVTAIDPDNGLRGSTDTYTITGTGFVDGLGVSMEDGSGSTPSVSVTSVSSDETTITVQISIKSGGPSRNIVWDVRVTNPDGTSAVLLDGFIVGVLNSEPNNPPTADAKGPYFGTEDSVITFNGTGSSDPDGDTLTYSWDFGDGSTGSGATPSHTYGWGDTFTVTLTVNDGKEGSDTASTIATVTEVNDVPTADANGTYSGTVNGAITFDGSGSSDPDNQDGTSSNDQTLTYSWDFGDSGTGTGVTQSHTYTSTGTFTVSLTVSDGTASDTTTTTATVSDVSQGVSVASITPNPIDRCKCTYSMEITGSGFSPNVEITMTGGDGPAPIVSNIVVNGDVNVTFDAKLKNGGPNRSSTWTVTVTNTSDGTSDSIPLQINP